MKSISTPLPPAPPEEPVSEAAPRMSSPTHAAHEPNPPVWTEPPASGTSAFTVSASGTFSRVVPLVPWSSPSNSLSVTRWNDDGKPSGLMTQFEADLADFVNGVLDPLMWNPGRIPAPTSGKCAYQEPATWPDGSRAVLICSLEPGHEGIHEPLDRAGNVMPLSADDSEAAA